MHVSCVACFVLCCALFVLALHPPSNCNSISIADPFLTPGNATPSIHARVSTTTVLRCSSSPVTCTETGSGQLPVPAFRLEDLNTLHQRGCAGGRVRPQLQLPASWASPNAEEAARAPALLEL